MVKVRRHRVEGRVGAVGLPLAVGPLAPASPGALVTKVRLAQSQKSQEQEQEFQKYQRPATWEQGREMREHLYCQIEWENNFPISCPFCERDTSGSLIK